MFTLEKLSEPVFLEISVSFRKYRHLSGCGNHLFANMTVFPVNEAVFSEISASFHQYEHLFDC
jgi:hypothetical protein